MKFLQTTGGIIPHTLLLVIILLNISVGGLVGKRVSDEESILVEDFISSDEVDDFKTYLEEAGIDHDDEVASFRGSVSLLSFAAESGSQNVAQFLIDRGADVNFVDSNGVTPLHRAILRGDMEIVEALAKSSGGLDPDIKDESGDAPLHNAAKKGTLLKVANILDRYDVPFDGGIRDFSGDTPLHILGRKNDAYSIKKYIELCSNLEVDALDDAGYSPLHYAAMKGRIDCVMALVKGSRHQADINSKDKENETALHLAIKRYNDGKIDDSVVMKLMMLGADPNIPGGEDGRTAFHYAVSSRVGLTTTGGFNPLARRLLQMASVEFDVQDKLGKTPLHIAALMSGLDFVKELCDKGARITLKDKNGNYPLGMAIDRLVLHLNENYKDFEKKFLLHSLRKKDSDAKTVAKSHLELIKYLAQESGVETILDRSLDTGFSSRKSNLLDYVVSIRKHTFELSGKAGAARVMKGVFDLLFKKLSKKQKKEWAEEEEIEKERIKKEYFVGSD